MKNKFNRYCAEIMGWRLGWEGHMGNDYWYNADDKVIKFDKYNPYGDLNQMAEVVEKLYGATRGSMHKEYDLMYNILSVGIKQAFRDFIISTMPEEA